MPKKLVFTRPAALTGLTQHATVAHELKSMFERFRRDYLPESVWRVANALLTEKALELKFSTGRTYQECMQEAIRREPYLALGWRPYMADKQFPEIEFRDEEVRDEHAS